MTPRPRSPRSARTAGTRFDRAIADYLAAHVDDRIDRRVTTGAKDRGDLGGLRLSPALRGGRVVAECKNTRQLRLSEWARQAETERDHDDTRTGNTQEKPMTPRSHPYKPPLWTSTTGTGNIHNEHLHCGLNRRRGGMGDQGPRVRDEGVPIPIPPRPPRGRPAAETARLHTQLAEEGLTDTEIATRLGITPGSLSDALRRHRTTTGQARLNRAASARLRTELATWYRNGCPL